MKQQFKFCDRGRTDGAWEDKVICGILAQA